MKISIEKIDLSKWNCLADILILNDIISPFFSFFWLTNYMDPFMGNV